MLTINSKILKYEFDWFNKVLDTRIHLYFEHGSEYNSIYDIEIPVIENDGSYYSKFVLENNLSVDERLLIILALIPHIKPELLDTFFINNSNFSRPFTEFGGWKGNTHNGFLPTGETASFILAGGDLAKRFELQKLFDSEHFFYKKNILKLNNHKEGEPFFSGELKISTEYLNKFTTGIYHKPDYSINFPAKLIKTNLEWDDLVLSMDIKDDIEDIRIWIENENLLMNEWGMNKVLKPGYRALFYGPPGTGKTLAASLIGKSVNMDVYRIDLSMVVSKYIGETEKNLAVIFDEGENKNWILFFDEAEALFGKRTQTNNSHDRYANQEVSYLLQRIEDYAGIIILATNLKSNIDEAFIRRFQSIIHFPIPDYEQRIKLWDMILPTHEYRDEQLNINEIAEKFDIAGGAILNVVRYSILKSLQTKKRISKDLIISGIKKEAKKEGRLI